MDENVLPWHVWSCQLVQPYEQSGRMSSKESDVSAILHTSLVDSPDPLSAYVFMPLIKTYLS